MTFRNAQQSRVYVGILGASCYARTVDVNSSTVMHDTTVLCDEERNFIPGIEETGSFSIAGPLDVDGATNGQFDAIAAEKANTTPTPITFMPLGTDGAAWLILANETDINLVNAIGETANWSMSATTHGQHDLRGEILDDATTAVTVDTDGSIVDSGAATTNGAVFHLHVTAYSGLTSDAIIVEGSATGAFVGEETTIATFASVTGRTSERVVVTGTVPRYLRVADDVTGTGSITKLVAVSRR